MTELGAVVVGHDYPAAMPDGTILRADIYRPTRPGSYPVLLQRTPYNKRFAQVGVFQHPAWYARQGYVVVVQDVRGRFASEGVFEPYRHEAADGAATVEWAARLDGTTGRVGTYGFSYSGASQLQAAGERPPSLACAAIGCAGPDFFDGWTYRGGALNLAFLLSWTIGALAIPDALRQGDKDRARRLGKAAQHLASVYATPLAELKEEGLLPSYFFDWVEHDSRDAYWASIAPSARFSTIDVPCLHVGGWYDIFLGGTIRNFLELSTHNRSGLDRHRLVVGPWQHVPWSRLNGEVDYGRAGDNQVDLLQVKWFDHWLKGRPLGEDFPVVSYFLLGADKWLADGAWPPAGSETLELFLRSDGRAASLSGSGELSSHPATDEPPDIFVYDPADPTPSVGGTSCCLADLAPIGAFDQRKVEIRNDVLIYTTRPLKADLDVAGPVDVVLHAQTDAPDTDWTAKLVDVYPDGRAINICDGILRARYAASLEEPACVEPGRVIRYRIQLGPTACRFRKGHALRLEISSSNFPAHDRNPNTGARGIDTEPFSERLATQMVFHDGGRPSRLCLCVKRKVALEGEQRAIKLAR